MRLTAPGARGTSSVPTSESVPPLVQAKLSASPLTTMLMVKIVSYYEVASSIRTGVVGGEAERVILVETGVAEEAVGSGDVALLASLPFAPPQLQLVRLCL